MGMDTKALIAKDVDLEDVASYLGTLDGYENVSIRYKERNRIKTCEPMSIVLTKDKEEVDIFTCLVYEEVSSTKKRVLILRYSEEAIEIMKDILGYCGGYLNENDCDANDYYKIEGTMLELDILNKLKLKMLGKFEDMNNIAKEINDDWGDLEMLDSYEGMDFSEDYPFGTSFDEFVASFDRFIETQKEIVKNK